MTPREIFSAFMPIPDADWDLVDDLFFLKEYKKGELVEEIGKQSKYFGILIEGILRGHYMMENGNEKTKGFRKPGTFFANYMSLVTKKPSRFEIQAIENAKAWFAPYEEFNQRTTNSLFWQTFLRKINEVEYLSKEQREFELLTMSAMERYQIFLKDFEEIKDRIPQYHIANYLGVDPSSLNRLLKKANSSL